MEGAGVRVVGGRELPAFGTDAVRGIGTGDSATCTSCGRIPSVMVTDMIVGVVGIVRDDVGGITISHRGHASNTLEADTGTVAEVRDAARATGGASIGSGQNIIAEVPGPNCGVISCRLSTVSECTIGRRPVRGHIAIVWCQSLAGRKI